VEFYEKSLAIAEELHQRNPNSADFARDRIVDYCKLADLAEKSGKGDAAQWWRKAYDHISAMKERGTLLPTDELGLEEIQQKLGLPPTTES